MLPNILALVDEWKDRVDFTCVYIQEAHASDEWPIGKKCAVLQATSIDMRISMAQTLQREMDIGMRLVVDSMELSSGNANFETAYASWPFRFWCVVQGVVTFKAMPREATYHLADLGAHLSDMMSTK
jgi:hypothetical protein